MRFGCFAPQGWRGDLREIPDPIDQFEAMITVARTADSGLWDSVWVYDHFHTIPTPELMSTFECWTATTALARATNRVKVGQMVGCNGYRNPSLYAKIASTVDVASHGRLYAGIGAGWYEEEWKAYGYEWNDTPVRMRKFREAVEIIHKMWTEDYPTYTGRHYTIDKPINGPKNSGKGKVPLWIGGGGEQVTLKLVAQYGDACNIGGGNPDIIRQKLDVLKRHCETVDRNYDEIIKSTSIEPLVILEKGADPTPILEALRGTQTLEDFRKRAMVGEPEQIAERFIGLRDAGATYIVVYIPRIAYDTSPINRLAQEIIPLVNGTS